jgi:glycosyltransferase involved in cell wall biosynthesis
VTDILFVHTNFPAQFGRLSLAMRHSGRRVLAIASDTAGAVSGVQIIKWKPSREAAKDGWPLINRFENDLIRGRAAADRALALKKQGFSPKVIVGHPGWGEMMFMSDIFPEAKIVAYGEYYVLGRGGDIGFDPVLGPWTLEHEIRGHTINAVMAMAYAEADAIVCPTPYQAGLMPKGVRERVRIIHEGVDTERLQPNAAAGFALADGRIVGRGTPLITYASRKLEPLRGYHVFMRALPKVMAALPTAEVLVIGTEGHGYGFAPPVGESWKARYFDEVKDKIDVSRVHFTGKLEYPRFTAALQASAAHVYYTYPFVLSWSLLEAMACGALIVGSDTDPVRDLIVHGQNGLLGDFFDIEGLADRLIEACERPKAFESLRKAARQTVAASYDTAKHSLPQWIKLIEELEGS